MRIDRWLERKGRRDGNRVAGEVGRLKKCPQLVRGYASLAQDRVQRGRVEVFGMHGNRHKEMPLLQLEVASGLPFSVESSSFKRSEEFPRLEDWQLRHARGSRNQP